MEGVDGRGGGGRVARPPSLPPMINPLTPPEYRERRDSHTFRPMSEWEAFYSQPMGRREYSHSGAAMRTSYISIYSIRDIHIYRPDIASYSQTHLSV
jgi:hypothetical protein